MSKQKKYVLSSIAAVSLIFLMIIMYLFALNNRYMQMDDYAIFDKWRNLILVPNPDDNGNFRYSPDNANQT